MSVSTEVKNNFSVVIDENFEEIERAIHGKIHDRSTMYIVESAKTLFFLSEIRLNSYRCYIKSRRNTITNFIHT